MTFLPIVDRELRVASRRRGTYLVRIAGALVALAIAGWIMIVASNDPFDRLGQALFFPLSTLLFLYSVAAGTKVTADCLSEEKREGTLGLLFLTDLKGYDIVAGKLAANSLNTFYGLIAAFPVLAISLLMGGVTSGEFWKVALVCTNLLFLSLSIGMFASAICRNERRAMSLAFLILLIVLGITPLVELGLNLADNGRANTTALLIFSPAFSCFSAFGQRMGFTAADFWVPVGLTQGYGWIFLVLASGIVPRSWQDRAASPLKFRAFWKLLFTRNSRHENARRSRLLNINPFLWLAARDPFKITFLWAVLFFFSVLWLWGWATWPKDWASIPVYVCTAVALHTILKFWITSEACYRFVQDRKNGALELLLSTPISVDEILRGQKLALIRQFAWPALFILAIDFFFLLAGLRERDINNAEDYSLWVMMWVAGMIVFVMDLFALSWTSMWCGLSSSKVNRAGNEAISRILLLPWIAFFICMTGAATMRYFSVVGFDAHVILLLWFSLCVVNNLIFLSWAKNNLRNRFRDIATQRFAPKPSLLRRWFARTDTANPGVPPVILR
ncbi:MAG: ABC transporter permease subunit [Verrucomicrobiota bacterium]